MPQFEKTAQIESFDADTSGSQPIMPEDTVRRSVKVAFGIGSMSQVLAGNSIANLANFVFNIGLGVSPALMGLAQALPRLWDAVTDPVMGHISDGTHSRWGRRRPYMFAGAILMGFFFAVLWQVPAGWSEWGYFSYFITVSLLFYTAFTVYVVPWGALGMGLTQNYHERTRVMAYGSFLGNIAGLLLPWLFKLTQLDLFEDGLEGARVVGIVLGVIIVATGVFSAFFTTEPHYAESGNAGKLTVWKSIQQTFGNQIFRRFIAFMFLVIFGFFTIASLSPYVIIYYVFAGDLKAGSTYVGLSGTVWVLSSIVFVPVVAWLSNRLGKKNAFSLLLGLMLIGHLSKIFCYNLENPLLMIFPPILISIGFVAVWTIGTSMVADICDVDEEITGSRREGSYGAIFSWITKFGSSIAILVGGLILEGSGFDEALGGGQTGATITALRIFEVAVPSCAILLSWPLLYIYPLSEQSVAELRERLNLRKSKISNHA